MESLRRADSWPFVHAREGKIVAVVWTDKKHRITPTKAKAQSAVRSWKLWKKRQGWKTSKLDTGYVARREGQEEWCGLHVYDETTRKRID